jgi:hypothetical protein
LHSGKFYLAGLESFLKHLLDPIRFGAHLWPLVLGKASKAAEDPGDSALFSPQIGDP